ARLPRSTQVSDLSRHGAQQSTGSLPGLSSRTVTFAGERSVETDTHSGSRWLCWRRSERVRNTDHLHRCLAEHPFHRPGALAKFPEESCFSQARKYVLLDIDHSPRPPRNA